ncbi:L,D-transpeptidase [Amycolatopsis anabasis]|uniref:L,D-transpeptidase n=1 Tax=Amycolatopsis anabasis TaxID=1840409 RepID=UPI00131A7909|nr:L,D-transpeptidase [Amycolatopsis anabasis]
MKKILVAVSGLALAGVLAACSGGASGEANVVGAGAAAGAPAPAATTPPSSSSSSTPPPSSSSAPTSTKTTPSSQPKKDQPKPVAETKPAPGVPCTITEGACVDLSAHKAWLLSGGKVTYGPVPMLPGKRGAATPAGTFRVINKVKNYHSREFDAPMPNSVFFYPGDAFHTGSLKNYSNGCIHLSAAASLKFFNTLQVGDPVQVVR